MSSVNFGSGAKVKFDLSGLSPPNLNGTYSILCWFKRTTDAGTYQRIFVNHTDDTTTGVDAYIDPSDALVHNGLTTGVTSPAVVDAWKFLGFVKNGIVSRFYYSDEGATGDVSTGTDTGGAFGSANAFNYLTMAGWTNTVDYPMYGSVCCVRVFPAALSVAELNAERDSATVVKSGSLLDWRGDSTSGSATRVFTGSPTIDSDEPSNITAPTSTLLLPMSRLHAMNGGMIDLT